MPVDRIGILIAVYPAVWGIGPARCRTGGAAKT
jgi:hypothetical protein